MLRSTLILLAATVLASPLRAQRTPPAVAARADSAPGDARFYEPAGAPRSLLVLLPGYGSEASSFEAGGFTPSTLPARLREQGVVTMVAVPAARTLYADEAALARLDAMILEARRRYGIADGRVAIGGFSAGGTGAVRYAQRCAARRCRATARVAAVFAVDAPLDYERLWRGEALSLRRRAPRTNVEEAHEVLANLRLTLGGSPEQAPAAYLARSPVLASAPDGGNARLLTRTPVRLYVEPDVQWWIENRSLDYHAMNAVDHAALVNVLRIAGNRRAELITTAGRGVRPDGRRHPHSWSIVDEADLAAWLARALASPA